MIKVGLTGNIGTGKSIVARIFETLGIPVYHADEVAKKFLSEESTLLAIREKFGDSVFDGDILDRKKLASIVFNNKISLATLNALIHPLVHKDLQKWFDDHSLHQYVIHEAAILFESGFYREFDKIITVAAPVDISVQRVMQRDRIGKEDVLQRMRNQWGMERKIVLANYVVFNDESQLVIPQVLAIHDELNEMKKGR